MEQRVKLEVTKNQRRLHIGSFFTDLNESDYQELVKIFADASKEEPKVLELRNKFESFLRDNEIEYSDSSDLKVWNFFAPYLRGVSSQIQNNSEAVFTRSDLHTAYCAGSDFDMEAGLDKGTEYYMFRSWIAEFLKSKGITLVEKDKWIIVTDSLPEKEGAYLVYDHYHRQVRICCYNPHHECWDQEDGDDYYTDLIGGKITHWTNLLNSPIK